MKILFIGDHSGNSFIQYQSLKKIYKNVDIISPSKILLFKRSSIREKILSYIFWHISPKLFEPIINKYLLFKIKNTINNTGCPKIIGTICKNVITRKPKKFEA